MRLAVEFGPCDAALRPHCIPVWVDVDAFHRREVDHQTIVDGRASRDIVAPTADGDLEAEIAAELDGIDDIGHAAAAGDQRRALVHQAVMDPSRIVIARIAGLQQLPRECAGEFLRGICSG